MPKKKQEFLDEMTYRLDDDSSDEDDSDDESGSGSDDESGSGSDDESGSDSGSGSGSDSDELINFYFIQYEITMHDMFDSVMILMKVSLDRTTAMIHQLIPYIISKTIIL